MGSLPCVSNLVGVPSLMTAVYNRVQEGKQQQHNSQKYNSQSVVKYSEGKFQSTHLQWCNWFSLCQSQCKYSPRSSHPWASHKSLQPDRSECLLCHSRSLQLGKDMDSLFFTLFSTSNLTCHISIWLLIKSGNINSSAICPKEYNQCKVTHHQASIYTLYQKLHDKCRSVCCPDNCAPIALQLHTTDYFQHSHLQRTQQNRSEL